MVTLEDIKSFWVNGELTSIYNINDISQNADSLIEASLNDAKSEMDTLKDDISPTLFDLYVKRLCVAIILSRLNINLDSVELPIKEANEIRKLINKKLSSIKKIENADSFNLLVASKGASDFRKDLGNF